MSDSAKSNLQAQVTALDASLSRLPSTEDVEKADMHGAITDQIEAITLLPGGAAGLVERYGADPRVAVVRRLAFALAGAVNDRDRAHALAATVFSMIEQLQIPDPWPRLNLCTAVQRLMMFKAPLPPAGSPASAAFTRMLRDALAGPPPVRATAAALVAAVFYGRHTAAFDEAELADLRVRVLALVDDPHKLTRMEAQDLSEFLSRPTPTQ